MLSAMVDTYLSVRRSLGFQLNLTERYLRSYVRFATKKGDTHVVSKTAISWAESVASENYRVKRMGALILFARFARAEDGRHEIPPSNVFCRRTPRPTPYIFTDEEVKHVLLETKSLGPPDALLPHTYGTLLGLLASTGLRISEALSLQFEDITPDGLVVRETKFFKQRLVPIHDSVAIALDKYVRHRRRARSGGHHLFISLRGGRLGYFTVVKTFRQILKAADIVRKPGGPHPRLHSFRHRFAVKSLQACPDTRDRIAQHMLALSTYMGHADIRSTYWYLESTPQLMADIGTASESFMRKART
jgi:integrase